MRLAMVPAAFGFNSFQQPNKRTTAAAAVQLQISTATYQSNAVNEDRVYIGSKQKHCGTTLFGVFDGHNGPEVAELAQRSLCESIIKDLQDSSSSNMHEAAFTSAVRRQFPLFDDAYAALVKPDFDKGKFNVAKVGCCALVAAITDDAICIANGTCGSRA